MSRKSFAISTFAATAALLACGLASATTTLNAGAYSITYNDTTPGFGAISGSTSGNGAVGFEWSLNPVVNVTSVGGAMATATFEIPDFTITVNPGYTLSGGLTASLGNLVYFLNGAGADASVTASFNVSVDGGPAISLPSSTLGQTAVTSTFGYFADSATVPVGGFTTFSFSNASITLNAWGGNFASIGGQPQNKLKFEFFAQAVPEPESYALLLAGMAVVGAIVRRRSAR